MGNCQSDQVSKIDLDQDEVMQELSAVKLLLLGPGESGKSTIVKQMKILHANGFTDDEFEAQTFIVFHDTISAMTAILDAMTCLGIKFEKSEREADAKTVQTFAAETDGGRQRFPPDVTTALKNLWKDNGIRNCFERSNEYQLTDAASFFYDQLDRIGSIDFKASVDDILHVRVRTTGIVELKFKMNDLHFRIIDVGGQRSERKKWLRCFDNVNAIIFVASLSEYDQVLFEDNKTNRMRESLQLFGTICNLEWFRPTSMIVFLNKKDLFSEKILRSPITICFPEYKGTMEYKACFEYIKQKYGDEVKIDGKQIYTFETCATDTNQLDSVFTSSIDTIVSSNLGQSGMT